MRNKLNLFFMILVASTVMPIGLRAAAIVEEVVEETDVSADAVAAYNAEGSLFQQITDLEQEKILMQLEKERAQLDLDLDRLAAEKIKLHMEIDTLSGRAEQQKQELDAAKAQLEAQTARLEREMQAFEEKLESSTKSAGSYSSSSVTASEEDEEPAIDFSKNYKLVNVFGAGNQLQATIADLATGQNKRLSVGRTLAGYTIKSISLDDGVVLVSPDGDTQMLNISSGNN